jgi:hypothetical protein
MRFERLDVFSPPPGVHCLGNAMLQNERRAAAFDLVVNAHAVV